jgi:hypothetical protein
VLNEGDTPAWTPSGKCSLVLCSVLLINFLLRFYHHCELHQQVLAYTEVVQKVNNNLFDLLRCYADIVELSD